jgi:hypothetical protein
VSTLSQDFGSIRSQVHSLGLFVLVAGRANIASPIWSGFAGANALARQS